MRDLYSVDRTKSSKTEPAIDNTKLKWVSKDVLFDDEGHAHVVGAIDPGILVKITAESAPKQIRRKYRPRPDPRERSDYSVSELAAEWNLSTHKIRSLFRDEPGVTKLYDKKANAKRKRVYVTLRIAVEVARRAEAFVINIVAETPKKIRRKIPLPPELIQSLKDARGVELERLTVEWNSSYGNWTAKELASARTRQCVLSCAA